ncbi:MAG: outer membrane protein transport protein, partial [Muriicola sp.]
AKDLNLGATMNFNFGTLESEKIQRIDGLQFGTRETQGSKINGWDFVYGLTYSPTIKDKYTLYTSAVVNTQINLISENSQTFGSFSQANGSTIEEINVNLQEQGLANTELKIPTIATFGLGFGEEKKWFMGAEYSFQQLSTFENRFLQIQNQEYKDASSYALGAHFIPDYTSFGSLLKRVTYRAGIRYDMTGIVVNDKEIDNFGITFGLGLPLGGSFSNLNLGFEWGKRGTTAADLIEEKYFRVNIGLSFNDRWFQKRKIN